MRFYLVFFFFIIFSGHSVVAHEFVSSSGKLSDKEFYRAVACGASPGGPCHVKMVKWHASKRQNLTVSIVQIQKNYPKKKATMVKQALGKAINALNGAGAGFHLKLVKGKTANIRIYLVSAKSNNRIRRTGNSGLDGHRIDAGYMNINWRTKTGSITDAGIAISGGILSRDVRSVVLEELTQTLGLLHDQRNAYYSRRSIFTEDGNVVTSIKGQDAMVLRTHYPRK